MKISFSSIANFLKGVKKIILLIIIVSATTLAVTTIISIWLNRYHNLRFPSFGTIQVVGVEVFGGEISTTQDGTPYIDWGMIYPGTTTNRSFYINNAGSAPVTLDLKISDVTFQNSKNQNVTENLSINNPLDLTWNYNNTILNPGEKIYVTLILRVSFDSEFLEYLATYDVRMFNFDIVIKPLAD